MRIDSHHHFWRYNADEYSWIGDSMAALRRDFLPEHLETELGAAGIDGAVSVQARQTLAETVWLLDMADLYPFLRGVVGWVPLVADDIERVLERLDSQEKLKGVRHVLQDESPEFMLQPAFLRGVGALEAHGLVYDILILERHLETTIEFVDRFPNQPFVLDHIGKPRIRDGEVEPWNTQIRELAKRPNVWCKISGVVSEADWRGWTEQSIQPYLDVVLEAFTPNRLMFGSDWPVCLVASGYERWAVTVERFASSLSAAERERIFGETAREVYSL